MHVTAGRRVALNRRNDAVRSRLTQSTRRFRGGRPPGRSALDRPRKRRIVDETMGFRKGAAWIAFLLGLEAAGCTKPTPPPVDLDPGATFAAHQITRGLVIDRWPAGGSGVIEPATWIRWDGDPYFVVRVDDAPVAALWLPETAKVVARAAASTRAPLLETVEPSWENGAVRLTLRPTQGPSLSTTTFRRVGFGSGLSSLSRTALTTFDARGTFRADVLDAENRPIGWFEIHVDDPVQPRVFQAALPRDLPSEGAAVAVALNSEVDWIMDRVIDVYRGRSSGRGDDDRHSR
jgi:hypothetical protein